MRRAFPPLADGPPGPDDYAEEFYVMDEVLEVRLNSKSGKCEYLTSCAPPPSKGGAPRAHARIHH